MVAYAVIVYNYASVVQIGLSAYCAIEVFCCPACVTLSHIRLFVLCVICMTIVISVTYCIHVLYCIQSRMCVHTTECIYMYTCGEMLLDTILLAVLV